MGSGGDRWHFLVQMCFLKASSGFLEHFILNSSIVFSFKSSKILNVVYINVK